MIKLNIIKLNYLLIIICEYLLYNILNNIVNSFLEKFVKKTEMSNK